MSSILQRPTDLPMSNPTEWCTDFLAQTEVTATRTLSLISTGTVPVRRDTLVTEYYTSRPTLTVICPHPSPGMECGYDDDYNSNTDWGGLDCPESPDGFCEILGRYDPYLTREECQQKCLNDERCKSYQYGWIAEIPCRLFNVGLGKNASHVHHPTPSGSMFWDRNCQNHVPEGCSKGAERTEAPQMQIATVPDLQPVVTAAPIPRGLQKRDDNWTHIPDYLSWLIYWDGVTAFTKPCSCLITSARPPAPGTTTTTVTKYTSTL
ncbi:hypothetical protein K458DRAFT_437246, partial [Lentithecium fluviatile CBS 122367]